MLSYVYTRDYKENGHVINRNIEPASPKTQGVEDGPSAGVENLNNPLTGVSVSEGEATPDAQASTVEAIPYIDIRVYVAADKFGISGLRLMSRSRIVSWAEKHWKSEVFPDVIREIFESVPAHDTALREAVIKLFSKNVDTLIKREDMAGVMSSFGNLASGVLKAAVEDKINLQARIKES